VRDCTPSQRQKERGEDGPKKKERRNGGRKKRELTARCRRKTRDDTSRRDPAGKKGTLKQRTVREWQNPGNRIDKPRPVTVEGETGKGKRARKTSGLALFQGKKETRGKTELLNSDPHLQSAASRLRESTPQQKGKAKKVREKRH